MTYFFELGNNPVLSAAEITAVFGTKENYKLVNERILLAFELPEFDEKKIIKKMGGIIKIGILDEVRIKNAAIDSCMPILEKIIDIKQEKLCFGISFYGRKKINIKHLGMDIKNLVKERGGNCRWVSGKENILSSVIVEQNKLLSKGFELAVIEDGNEFYIGRTMAVQPFKELSCRDYGRPARDDRSGMLPPKLAQIMLNLASANLSDKTEKRILDPFCGSGTIITEAMLMGFKYLTGSDLSPRAVSDTKKNINWIIRHAEKLDNADAKNFSIDQIDVKNLSKFIKPKTIDAIATEPYLGPQRGPRNFNLIKKELEALYSSALSQFKLILKPQARVVIIFPIFIQKQNKHFLNIDLSGFKITNPLPLSLQNEKILRLSFRKTIIYGREGQKVWREIFVLELE